MTPADQPSWCIAAQLWCDFNRLTTPCNGSPRHWRRGAERQQLAADLALLDAGFGADSVNDFTESAAV
jgi:hypothetical protein